MSDACDHSAGSVDGNGWFRCPCGYAYATPAAYKDDGLK